MPHKGKDMRLLSVTDCSPAPGPVQAPISFAICWLPSLHIIRDEKCRLAERLGKLPKNRPLLTSILPHELAPTPPSARLAFS